jgi:hypothetical protein
LTGYRNVEDFGASQTDVSFGRYYKPGTDNFNFVAMAESTPGLANSYPKVGPIVISEIMYNPDWPDGGSYTNEQYEYIELKNISVEPVMLFDSVTSERGSSRTALNLPSRRMCRLQFLPGGYMLVDKSRRRFHGGIRLCHRARFTGHIAVI